MKLLLLWNRSSVSTVVFQVQVGPSNLNYNEKGLRTRIRLVRSDCWIIIHMIAEFSTKNKFLVTFGCHSFKISTFLFAIHIFAKKKETTYRVWRIIQILNTEVLRNWNSIDYLFNSQDIIYGKFNYEGSTVINY